MRASDAPRAAHLEISATPNGVTVHVQAPWRPIVVATVCAASLLGAEAVLPRIQMLVELAHQVQRLV